MTWFRVDDKLPGNRKVRKLGGDRLPAMGLWTLCGSWSSDHLTDGFVPSEEVRRYDPKERFARRLVDVGLWITVVQDEEPGYLFHDFHDFNPTSEKVLAEREASKERVRKWREARKSGTRNGASNGVGNGVRTGPPTRPDPTPPKGGRGEGSGKHLKSVDKWCGECDETTRQVELPDGRPKRCPSCHPRRETA